MESSELDVIRCFLSVCLRGMLGSFSLTSAVLSSYLGDLFSLFPSLVLRRVTRCSTFWLRFPEVSWASGLFVPLSVSVSFCHLGPWVRSMNALFSLSSQTALQWKVVGYISVLTSFQTFGLLWLQGFALSNFPFNLFAPLWKISTLGNLSLLRVPACVYSLSSVLFHMELAPRAHQLMLTASD